MQISLNTITFVTYCSTRCVRVFSSVMDVKSVNEKLSVLARSSNAVLGCALYYPACDYISIISFTFYRILRSLFLDLK